MITTEIQNKLIKIRAVIQNDLDAVLQVYQHSEDFLSLGPVSTASMEMVLKDLEISKEEGGIFCGVYTEDEKMIGVVDYVPNNFQGNPQIAFLSLLMIDSTFRGQGIGKAIVEAVENEIKKDPAVTVILSGVQVNNPQAVRFWQRNGYCITSEPKLMPDQTIVFDLQKQLK
jgi:ribosomal protein S18 acetylase RimI-like enzyme